MVKKLIFILFIAATGLKAQDIHFTQWMFSPLNLNPGETGRFEGDYRIVGNFRSQWGATMGKQYKTLGMSYDRVFSAYGQDFSAGLQFDNDRSSIGNLTQNKLMLSWGYNKLVKGNYLSGGIQIGLLHKGIDPNAYSYPVQWDVDQGEFSNNSLSNMENFSKTNDYSFDFNFGVGWARRLGDKLFPEVGLAWYHLNKPSESFFNDSETFSLRQVYNAKFNYKLNDRYTISPNVMYMYQNKAQDLVLGVIGKMKMDVNKAKIDEVFVGMNFRDGYKRNYDAANLIIGAVRQEWQVGISYDINVSGLSSVTHYRGAFELSVIYIAQSSEPSIYNVPCDRY
jgi:type IX secretion system PorP/SprF family membrane protein